MKNKNILAITLVATMGFANAGILEDIANPIVTASVIANIFLFFIIFPVIMPKLAP
jgi:hypothetical protein